MGPWRDYKGSGFRALGLGFKAIQNPTKLPENRMDNKLANDLETRYLDYLELYRQQLRRIKWKRVV